MVSYSCSTMEGYLQVDNAPVQYYLVYRSKNYQVWSQDGRQVYGGYGKKQKYIRAKLTLVRIAGGYNDYFTATVVKEVEPGSRHKQAIKDLVAEIKLLEAKL